MTKEEKFKAFTEEGTLLFNQPTASTYLKLECYKLAANTRVLDEYSDPKPHITTEELIICGNKIYKHITSEFDDPEHIMDTITEEADTPVEELPQDVIEFRSFLKKKGIEYKEKDLETVLPEGINHFALGVEYGAYSIINQTASEQPE